MLIVIQNTVETLLLDTSIIQTPLLYVDQFSWSQKDQNLYKLYLCNADISLIWTLIISSSVNALRVTTLSSVTILNTQGVTILVQS